MPEYRVPVKTVVTEILHVTADSKEEEAMDLALEDDDEDFCRSVEIIDGAPECYYPDIEEID